MLNRYLLCFALISTTFFSRAQGVHFEEGNWAGVRQKAIEQNRLIYLDVSTTWCGACKILDAKIFPQKAAGDKYNSLFVNYRVDAEKGEGIDLAKKYQVSTYPTHLFIDPKTDKIIFRTTGAIVSGISGDPRAVAALNADADLAIQERDAPMTWEMYEEAFAGGKRDKEFLMEFSLKARRLEKNNDNIMNAYVALMKKDTIKNEDIIFLGRQIMTIDNDAIALLVERKEWINSRHPEVQKYFENQCKGWTQNTLKKAVDKKNPALLDKMEFAMKNYELDSDDAKLYWFRTEYYARIGDEANAWIASRKQGAYLISLSDSNLMEADKKALNEGGPHLVLQLRPSNNASGYQGGPKKNESVGRNSHIQYSKTTYVANMLNTMAWNVYKKYSKDKTKVTEALKWSQRAVSIGQPLDGWFAFADTHAHLLYVSGKKAEAILLQQKAVERARSQQPDQLVSYEETLRKMQEGTL
jgi:thiol-disulfide isomerase/thioredoxin